MANPYSDLILALNDVYPRTLTSLTAFRGGGFDAGILTDAKQVVALYKVYANKRLALENGPNKTKNLLGIILDDLGEGPIYIERNITILRAYISACDPSYIEPV